MIIKDVSKYIGMNGRDVADELRMDMDDFLDEIFVLDYYVCRTCGRIMKTEDINMPCSVCRRERK